MTASWNILLKPKCRTILRILSIGTSFVSNQPVLNKHLSILFYGTDEFSLHSLQCLYTKAVDVIPSGSLNISNLEIVCKDKTVPVGTYADKHGLPTHMWPFDVPIGRFDVGIVVSFGHLIPVESINACRQGMVNVHPSLLPRWRGAAPLQHTLISGDQVTGISIVDVAPHHFDVGHILIQETFPVPHRCTLADLTSQLAEKGGELLLQCLNDLPGYRQQSKPQETSGATKATKVHPKMGRVSWSSMTAHQVDCLSRGLPFSLFSFWKGKKIKLLSMVHLEESSAYNKLVESLIAKSQWKARPGKIIFNKAAKLLTIITADGKWVNFQKVSYDGCPMSAKTFHKHYISKQDPEERIFDDDVQMTTVILP